MNKTILLFMICFMQFFLLACTNKDEVKKKDDLDEQSPHQLTLAFNIGFESGFDPIKGWGFEGSPLFHSTLFKRNEHLKIVNDLASDYEVDKNIWTVYLHIINFSKMKK